MFHKIDFFQLVYKTTTSNVSTNSPPSPHPDTEKSVKKNSKWNVFMKCHGPKAEIIGHKTQISILVKLSLFYFLTFFIF